METIKYRPLPSLLNFYIALTLFIGICAYGQRTEKKHLTSQQYSLWSYLEPKKISVQGNWVSYSVAYESGIDTLFISSTHDQKKLFFPDCSKGSFFQEKFFAGLTYENELLLLNLKSGIKRVFKDVKEYYYGPNGNYITTMITASDGSTTILIRSMDGKVIREISYCSDYAYNPETGLLTFTRTSDTSNLLMLDTKSPATEKVLIWEKGWAFTELSWQQHGASIGFILKCTDDSNLCNEKARIGFYDCVAGQKHHFSPSAIDSLGFSQLTDILVAPDGSHVFFTMAVNPEAKVPNQNVQVWHASDYYLQPVTRLEGGYVKHSRVAMWNTKTGKINVLTDKTYSELMLSPDCKYAILWNPVANEPQPHAMASRNYKSIDLDTGAEKVFLENFPSSVGTISISPNSKYVCYFRDSNWYLYNLSKNSHTKINGNATGSFAMGSMGMPHENTPVSSAVWTADGEQVLLHDTYDLWKINGESGIGVRQTRGRELGTTYRLAKLQDQANTSSSYINSTPAVNLDSSVVVTSSCDTVNGLYLLSANGRLKPISRQRVKISLIHKAAENESLVFVQETYQNPPQLIACHSNKPLMPLYQSNQQHKEYFWGNAKSIAYKNASGKSLKGTLYYPANFDPDKTYPLLVHIYDRQSDKFNDYINPTSFSGNGFNVTSYVTSGYFVLLPDIAYELGNPGPSATDCVVAATRQAIELAPIDRKRIGLIGHSFGGYETDFIITQTDIFAAAVSGAAITDLVSSYLYISWNYLKPNFWHYESGQLRMGKPLYDDYLSYINNSPVYHAAKVKTPLLSWAGDDDKQVHYYQSLEFYLALRRLSKNHTLLIYPGQRHVLTDQQQQLDLNVRIKSWFDHYLNNGPESIWMQED